MIYVRKTVVVAQGETINFLRDEYIDNYVAYQYQPGLGPDVVNFFNYGVINFIAKFQIDPYAYLIMMGDSLPPGSVVENHGTITIDAQIGYALGFVGGAGAAFTNTGQITIRGQVEAFGLQFWNPPVTNSGRILVDGRDFAIGLHIDAGGVIRNSGEIAVRATAGDAYAVQLLSNDVRIENDNLITAISGGSGRSIGINFTGYGLAPAQVVNHGTITADDALLDGVVVPSELWKSSQQVENLGTINGRVALGIDADSLTNSKLINGTVELGAGDDLYDGRSGRAMGLVAGGDGADTLRGGAEFDYLHGNAGADSVSGGLGDDWVVGGKDADSLAGDAGADVVYANLGADTGLGGDGADWVRGGQDNDSLDGGAGDDLMWGDRGDDSLAGGAGADVFGMFAGAGLERILDFSLAQGDRVRIEGAAAYSVRLQGGDTVIDLGNGDQVVLVGVDLTAATGWILAA